jgi:glycosyltransferase involved in cell wall biosynthesis
MLDISVIILTYNEEKHIERCVLNAKKFAKEIFIVDSFSTDKTIEIAERLGAKVFQNKWENNHAKQFNWGLRNTPITTEWVFRLDADEYLTDELIEEIHTKLPTLETNVNGIIFERKTFFFSNALKRGIIKMNMLRLFKNTKGFCEERWMDEHIILNEGISVSFNHCFVDDNLNNLGWWIQKHNGYSIREAIDMLNIEYQFIPEKPHNNNGDLSEDAKLKRQKKHKYAKMPLFWRAFYYFVYRYFVKLQGWWYRTLVDAKIYEIKKHCGNDVSKMKVYIKNNYQIEI